MPADNAQSLFGSSSAGLIRIVPMGMALSCFAILSYLLCLLLGLFAPDIRLHVPWLQFLPGFTWLTWGSFFLGLAELVVYAWYVAIAFGSFYNFFFRRT